MIQPTSWDINQIQTRNRFGWNKNRSNKPNRSFLKFQNLIYNQEYRTNTQGIVQNQQGYFQYQSFQQSNSDSVIPTGQSRSFTHPTWNKPSRYIPIDTPNILNGVERRLLQCYHCRQIEHYASECPNPNPNPRASHDYAPVCGNYK